MGNIIAIESKQPHVLVHASDAAHVVPLALLEDVAKGAKPSEILTEPVICRIIEEWLELTA